MSKDIKWSTVLSGLESQPERLIEMKNMARSLIKVFRVSFMKNGIHKFKELTTSTVAEIVTKVLHGYCTLLFIDKAGSAFHFLPRLHINSYPKRTKKTTMKIFSAVLAIAAFITGLIAAYYWHRASKADISPLRGEGGTEPVHQHSSHMGWTVGIMQAFQNR
jgi:hypothetical protein